MARTILKITDYPELTTLSVNNPTVVLRDINNDRMYVGGVTQDVFRYHLPKKSSDSIPFLKDISAKLKHHVEEDYPHRAVNVDTSAIYWYRPVMEADGFISIACLPDAEKVDDYSYDNTQDILDFVDTLEAHKITENPIHKFLDEGASLTTGYAIEKDGDFLNFVYGNDLTFSPVSGTMEDQEFDYNLFNSMLDNHKKEIKEKHTIKGEGGTHYHLEIEDDMIVIVMEEETLI